MGKPLRPHLRNPLHHQLRLALVASSRSRAWQPYRPKPDKQPFSRVFSVQASEELPRVQRPEEALQIGERLKRKASKCSWRSQPRLADREPQHPPASVSAEKK